jgi:hypothetical protein
MRAYHVAALITLVLIYGFLLQACATALHAPTAWAYTLPPDADDDDRFCVIIPRSPRYPPEAVGPHCARVGDLRLWLAHLQYAH